MTHCRPFNGVREHSLMRVQGWAWFLDKFRAMSCKLWNGRGDGNRAMAFM